MTVVSIGLRGAALDYGRRGWPVLPLIGKRPLTSHGVKDATTDKEQIEQWWAEWPDANIGLATGIAFDVLDIDTGHGGRESFDQLLAEYDTFEADTYIVKTGSGGWHYYFTPMGAGNRAGMRPGLDWRGKGGYVVAPPSVHPATGREYRVVEAYKISEAPGWLVELVRPTGGRPVVEKTYRQELDDDGRRYVERALAKETEKLRAAPVGSRNVQLNNSGLALFGLVKGGLLDFDETWTELEDIAHEIGLTDQEIPKTLNSAFEDAEARGVPEMPERPVADLVPGYQPDGESAEPASQTGPAGGHRRVTSTPASAIRPQATVWLWEDHGQGRIPLGALTLLGGREGVGKSTYVYDLAARVSRGELEGEFHGKPKGVLVAAYEDSWSRTIIPRLVAAGADLNRVRRLDVVTTDDLGGTLSLPHDIPGLTAEIKEHDVALIILDPLLSRLGADLDSHKDAEVRRALEPLTGAIEPLEAAAVGLIHVNKGNSTDPLTTLMGSRAFPAVARAVLFVMADPDDPETRLFGQPKNNLGRSNLPTLTFTIDSADLGGDGHGRTIRTSKLRWTGETLLSISDAIQAAERGGDSEAHESATKWLSDYLSQEDGYADSKTVKDAGKHAGHTEAALRHARKRLGVSTPSYGFPRRTWWCLPGVEPGEGPPQSCASGAAQWGELTQQHNNTTGKPVVPVVQSCCGAESPDSLTPLEAVREVADLLPSGDDPVTLPLVHSCTQAA